MTNYEREHRHAPAYGAAPVSGGPFWLGFNDARNGREYHNDYRLLVDKYEYQRGYAAGQPQGRRDDT